MKVNLCDGFVRNRDFFVRYVSTITKQWTLLPVLHLITIIINQWTLLVVFEINFQGIDIAVTLIQLKG